MDKRVLQAYEMLVPADQLVVDAMIASLFKKDEQIGDMVKELHKRLDEKEPGK